MLLKWGVWSTFQIVHGTLVRSDHTDEARSLYNTFIRYLHLTEATVNEMEQIEQATLNDVPKLAQLLELLFTQEADFKPDRDKQERAVRLIIESNHVGVIFAAREVDVVVGMVSLLFTISTAEGGPVCWLEDMIVRPDRRGTGLGSRLLQRAIQYAQSHGYGRITLLTDKVNAGAVRFYNRHGFVESAMMTLRLALKSA